MGEVALTAQTCRHCGQVSSLGEFCCPGCEAVSQVIKKLGLNEFYRRRTEGVCFQPAAPPRGARRDYSSWDATLAATRDTTRDAVRCSARTFTVFAHGVHCSACLWLIERLPEVAPEVVKNARLDLSRSVIEITLSDRALPSQAGALLESLGYPSELLVDPDDAGQRLELTNRRALVDLGIAGALAGNVMLLSIPLYAGLEGSYARLFEWLCGALSIPTFLYCGRSFFRSAWVLLKRGVFSIDVPIFVAMAVAFGFSFVRLVQGSSEIYFDSLTALIFLLLASRYALSRLRQSTLTQSNRLFARTGSTTRVVGDRFVPKEGGELDCDAVIRQGEGWFSQSFLTGESLPVRLRAGDTALAGSSFEGSASASGVAPTLEVTAVGEQTFLARMIEQVRQASTARPRVDHVYERWAKRLLLVVSVIALGLVCYFALRDQTNVGLQRALALLIVTCPCGFALGVPLLTTLLSRRALERGLVVRDPDFFEKLTQVTHLCFDKTGTLTDGRMQWVSGECPESLRLVLIAMVSRSKHPVSRALAAHFGGVGTSSDRIEFETFEERPGVGLFARYQGRAYALERGEAHASRLGVRVRLTEDAVGVAEFVLQDALQPDARPAVQALQARGLVLTVLSGDQPQAVIHASENAGIPKHAAHAKLLPEEKAHYVAELQSDRIDGLPGARVLMVGDGLNDALSFRAAHASLAVFGGLEEALKSSSGYALRPGLSVVSEAFSLSDRFQTTLRGSFLFSTLYNGVACVLAVSGVMSPLLAAVLMPCSAVSVFLFISTQLRRKAA